MAELNERDIVELWGRLQKHALELMPLEEWLDPKRLEGNRRLIEGLREPLTRRRVRP